MVDVEEFDVSFTFEEYDAFLEANPEYVGRIYPMKAVGDNMFTRCGVRGDVSAFKRHFKV